MITHMCKQCMPGSFPWKNLDMRLLIYVVCVKVCSGCCVEAIAVQRCGFHKFEVVFQCSGLGKYMYGDPWQAVYTMKSLVYVVV